MEEQMTQILLHISIMESAQEPRLWYVLFYLWSRAIVNFLLISLDASFYCSEIITGKLTAYCIDIVCIACVGYSSYLYAN